MSIKEELEQAKNITDLYFLMGYYHNKIKSSTELKQIISNKITTFYEIQDK